MANTLSKKAGNRLKNIAESELLCQAPPVTQLNDLLEDADMLKNAAFVAATLSAYLAERSAGAGRVEELPSFHFVEPSEVACHLVYIRDELRKPFLFCWSSHPAIRWAKELKGAALAVAQWEFLSKLRQADYEAAALQDTRQFTQRLWMLADTHLRQNKQNMTERQLGDLSHFFACRQQASFNQDLAACAWYCQIMGITLSDLQPAA